VYRPVWTAGGKPLLFEAYFRYDAVNDRSRDLWRGFSGIMLSSLVAVLVLLTPLLWTFYRRARAVQAHREEVMVHAVHASTEERRRIAATLHDGVVQQLAGASFVVAGEAERAAAHGDIELADRLSGASTTFRDSVAAMRSLLVDIYPPSLRAGGLASALTDLGKAVSGSNARIRITVDPEAAASLAAEQQQAVFRVAQECLRNAVRHADAMNISLDLSQDTTAVRLDVVDDGVGFEPSTSERAAADGHFGLRLMADVALTIGATLSVSSTRGNGAHFRLEIPKQ
jgi:signal transduction histidine kinase